MGVAREEGIRKGDRRRPISRMGLGGEDETAAWVGGAGDWSGAE